MSLKAFLKSKLFLKNLGIAAGITLFLLLFAIFILRIYTDHGESLAVPDLHGMKAEQAAEKLDDKDLNFKIIDSLFVKGAEPGTIVGQIPVAGFRVKENRTVFFTICTRAPEMVPMPKLTDIAYRQALNILINQGLEIGNVEYKPSEYTDLVLDQQVYYKTIEVGQLIPKGTKIDLVVGQASNGEKTDVPYLIGDSYDEAKWKLDSLVLNFGAVIYEDSLAVENDTIIARIWKQRPDPSMNSQLIQGQSVDVWLTSDPEKLEKLLKNK